MKKVLVMSSRIPYPLTAGYKIRIYYLSRILARKYRVDLLAIDENRDGNYRELEKIYRRVRVFRVSGFRLRRQALFGLVGAKPLQVKYYFLPEVQEWLKDHAGDYDLIYCNHIRMAEYLRETGIPKLIDFHDAISMHYQSSLSRARGLWKMIYQVESRRVLNYELAVLQFFDKAFITAPADRNYLLSRFYRVNPGQEPCPVVVIPMGVKEEVLSRPECSEEEDWVVFLGKMDYYPNQEAAVYFAREVFPLVKKISGREMEFVIVGTSPTGRVLELENIPGVRVTGFVEDPYFYLERARVVVAPVRLGAGIQNKILEAMALKKAVVTTPVGVRGIHGAEPGRHLLAAASTEEIAETVAKVLEDEELRRHLGKHGRALVEQKYTWEVIEPQVLREIDELV
ncbi:glycosyltransferase [Calderihabitans maritimus]|uniref:Glycosyl transferase group I n=1 Tax=Calderihabitans maritimus TaxID=1246530 RepID=A0A1Z5HX11_9FIRM|nr:glycosyltransferase [Calderihabitans maritimus]GAW94072.1 glycosyl transferase group I [Calderihabitans maritimus]